MLATWHFDELRDDFDIIVTIVQYLHTPFTSIIGRPCVPIEVVTLVASMSRTYTPRQMVKGLERLLSYIRPRDW